MTLVLGARCKDGVVLAADTEMTAIYSHKYLGSKIRMRAVNTACPFYFAYAGEPVFAEMCMQSLAIAILKAEKEGEDIYTSDLTP